MSLNAVVPEGPSGGDVDRLSPDHLESTGIFGSVISFWETTHISTKGKYSTARMQMLHEYCKRCSFARAVAVCVATPIPALLVLIGIESLPLRDPAEGWQANYMMWLRLFFTATSAGVGSVLQVRGMVPALLLAPRTIAAIGITAGCGCTLAIMTTAAWSVFPLPFTLVLSGIPFPVCVAVPFYLATRCQDLSELRGALKLGAFFIVLQSTFAVVYTAFSAVFELCTPTQQTLLVLLLSVIKVGIKNMVAWMSAYNEVAIPVVVVFTADVFNAIYVSICMQLVVSGWTSVLVIALDATQAALSVMDIERNTQEIQAAQRRPSTRAQSVLSIVFRRLSRGTIDPNPIRDRKVHSVISPAQTSPARLTKIPRARTSRPTQIAVARSNAKVVEEARKLMFRSEYLMLVEYVECSIPVLYAVYLLVLANLSNAQYYPHARSLSSDKIVATISSLLVYALLETLALMGLHVLLKQRYGFSPLHQLAFVLETEVLHVQGRLFVWIVALPQLTVEHFGADFSFRFGWIRS